MGIFSRSKDTGPSASNTPYAGRTLQYSYDSIWGRQARIIDPTNNTTLYEIDLRNRSPQIKFHRAGSSDNDVAGTVKVHSLSRKMEAEINGQSFKISNKNWKACDLQWTSPAFGGQLMNWHRSTMWTLVPLVLTNEQQLPVAKWTPGGLSLKKAGKIELMDANIPPWALEEVLITGLAVMQDTEYHTTAMASTNASAASVAVAG
jgi:hypothetical protein